MNLHWNSQSSEPLHHVEGHDMSDSGPADRQEGGGDGQSTIPRRHHFASVATGNNQPNLTARSTGDRMQTRKCQLSWMSGYDSVNRNVLSRVRKFVRDGADVTSHGRQFLTWGGGQQLKMLSCQLHAGKGDMLAKIGLYFLQLTG